MPVAPAAGIEPGAYRTVDVDGTAVAVFNIDGTFFAIEDVCTHDGGRLAGGVVEGDQVVCPRHGARFCVRTGAALTAPAYEPTACLPVRVEQGVVQVRDDRWD
ncbi:MAG: non-heme iron oxygenase ferredoxin subunit [Burkholderiales bacterium]|nr:non-heme iron oxygenase ferredoxin subunit [Burkholderiales bacterium]